MLIGIHGKKRTGKNTAAGILRTFTVDDVRMMAFGDRLKYMCAETFGVSVKLYYDQETKEVPCGEYGSPRDHMIGLSDAIKAKYGNDFFIKVVERSIEDVRRSGSEDHIFITDVRYESEADMVRRLGGRVLHVLRDTGEASAHSSESGIAVGSDDFVVENNGSLEDFRDALYGVFEKISPTKAY